MAARRATKRARDGAAGDALPPPFPGAAWGDPEEFQRFWGKSADEIAAECERETSGTTEREIYLSGEEFLKALKREMKPAPGD